MAKPRAGAAEVSESYYDPTPAADPVERNRPVHAVRVRNIRAAIWANDSEQGTRFNVTFARLYKDNEGQWRSSEGFGRDDLLLVAKVADLVHTWITDQMQGQDIPF